MRFSSEVLLMLVALGMYLYDSVLLLYRAEGVLFVGLRGRWQARLGSESARLGGRLVLLPNPLQPHVPLFRLAWNFETVPTTPQDVLVQVTQGQLSAPVG